MSFIQTQTISQKMGMSTPINVIIPDTKPVNEMPVIYLLHGLSDNCSHWSRRTSIELFADKHECVVIMPEVQRSFYADMVKGIAYFSYITDELPEIAKRLFNITSDPEKTFVMGLSMGGYGALKCGLTYPKRYKGIAAFSSVADLQKTIDENIGGIMCMNECEAIFGGKNIGEENDLFALAKKVSEESKKPEIFMSCGTLDVLYEQNIRFRDHLEELDYKLGYIEWEDNHCWPFWNKCVEIAIEHFIK